MGWFLKADVAWIDLKIFPNSQLFQQKLVTSQNNYIFQTFYIQQEQTKTKKAAGTHRFTNISKGTNKEEQGHYSPKLSKNWHTTSPSYHTTTITNLFVLLTSSRRRESQSRRRWTRLGSGSTLLRVTPQEVKCG